MPKQILENKNELEKLRKRINKIDSEILKLISERMELSQKIGEYKKERGMKILDEGREKEVYEKIKRKAVELELNPKIIEKIYKEIITESKRLQE